MIGKLMLCRYSETVYKSLNMSKSYLKIAVPKPCQENWDTMTPNEKGRHCLNCQKTVVDFTEMTDREILNFFQTHKSATCGRFLETQLHRAITPSRTSRIQTRWAWLFSVLLLPTSAKTQTPQQTELTEKQVIYANQTQQEVPTKEKSQRKHKPYKKEETVAKLLVYTLGLTNLQEPPPLSFKSSEELLKDIFQTFKNWLVTFLSFLKEI